MSGSADKTVVFFDLGQTLGFECRPADPALPVEFTAYDDIPRLLEELRQGGARLGVLTAGTRWTPELVHHVLTISRLDGYFDEALVQHWAADSDTHFRAAAERAGTPCFFVSPNRRRRLQAKLGGVRPVPHPALAPAMARGAHLAYFIARGPRLPFARVATLCRTEPVAIPIRTVARGHELVVYAVTAEYPGATGAGTTPPRSATERFKEAAFRLAPLGDADQLATADLCFVKDAGAGSEESVAFRHQVRNQVLVEEHDHALILALDGRASALDIGLSSCCDRSTELQPELALLLPADAQAAYQTYAVTHADKEAFAALTQEMYHDYLSPWWKDLGGPPESPIESRHVEHPDNARAVAAAAGLLSAICGSENVRLCPFDGPFGKPLSNIEAHIPADPASPHREEVVILGAHLDSIDAEHEDHAHQPAPGVDDDASGIAGVLSAARVLRTLSQQKAPLRAIRFVLFNAEEILLGGSRKYAADKVNVDNVVAMFQMDMIGYIEAYPPGQCEVHTGIGHPFDDPQKLRELRELSSQLGGLIQQAAAAVSPSLDIKQYPIDVHCEDDGSADSDHAPFYWAGCPACKVCEDFYFDTCEAQRKPHHPTYHSILDVSVDEAYATDVSRAVACAVWMRANAT